jgi:hypothetical protein
LALERDDGYIPSQKSAEPKGVEGRIKVELNERILAFIRQKWENTGGAEREVEENGAALVDQEW